MRFVADRTTFKAHGVVLERERPTLVAMAIQAPRLVGGKGLRHRGTRGAVRVVAIDATHRAFGQPVVIRPLKLRPDIQVAARTQLIDRSRLALD